MTLEFSTDEGDIEGFLELVKLHLSKLLVHKTADTYDKLMRAKYMRGEMRMDRQARKATPNYGMMMHGPTNQRESDTKV